MEGLCLPLSFTHVLPGRLTSKLGMALHGGSTLPLMLLVCPLQRERLSRGFNESVLVAGDPNNNEKFTNRIK